MVFFIRRLKPLDLFVLFATNVAVGLYIWPPFIKEFEKNNKKTNALEQTPIVELTVAEPKNLNVVETKVQK
jgi:hypothetical protein